MKKGTENMEIKELVTNEEFKAAAGKVETVEEAVELCKAHGVEITGEELVEAIKKSNSEELNEEALDNVAGGGKYSTALGYVYYGAGYLGGRLAGWSKSKSKNYASKCQTVGKVLGYGFDILL